jgi:hypothetical protein
LSTKCELRAVLVTCDVERPASFYCLWQTLFVAHSCVLINVFCKLFLSHRFVFLCDMLTPG